MSALFDVVHEHLANVADDQLEDALESFATHSVLFPFVAACLRGGLDDDQVWALVEFVVETLTEMEWEYRRMEAICTDLGGAQ